MFENGRFEGENSMTRQCLLGMVSQNSNPVPNAEIHYAAHGSYKYKRQVLDRAEVRLPKNPTLTRG